MLSPPSKLIEFLSGLRLEPDTGLYALYQPFSGYGSTVILFLMFPAPSAQPALPSSEGDPRRPA